VRQTNRIFKIDRNRVRATRRDFFKSLGSVGRAKQNRADSVQIKHARMLAADLTPQAGRGESSVMNLPTSLSLRFLAQPNDVNFGGKMHGGALMRWIDQAGYACAVSYSGRYCVTKYVSDIEFARAIQIGDLIEVAAQVIHTGRTSLHVKIDVFAGNPRTSLRERATDCIMVFVAVDDVGHPIEVPSLPIETDEARVWQAYALRALELHRGLSQNLADIRAQLKLNPGS
jgi:uncharacterized protein (TIGR00369 family)